MYTLFVDNEQFFISDETLSKIPNFLTHSRVYLKNENSIYVDADKDSFKCIISMLRGYDISDITQSLRDKMLVDIKVFNINFENLNDINFLDKDIFDKDIFDKDIFDLKITDEEKKEFDTELDAELNIELNSNQNISLDEDVKLDIFNINNLIDNIHEQLNSENIITAISTDENIKKILKEYNSKLYNTDITDSSDNSDNFDNFDNFDDNMEEQYNSTINSLNTTYDIVNVFK
jgi:superfamily II DNA or RNA helicase